MSSDEVFDHEAGVKEDLVDFLADDVGVVFFGVAEEVVFEASDSDFVAVEDLFEFVFDEVGGEGVVFEVDVGDFALDAVELGG